MSFIAFLDLLGTKDLSMEEQNAYANSIKIFSDCIADGLCDTKCKAYAFSDCAYVESKTLTDLLGVLNDLRNLLLQKRRFFSAAITSGTLNADISSKNNQYFCVSFNGADVSKVYVKQSQLKGIGIRLDKSVFQKGELKQKGYKAIRNFYIPNIDYPKTISIFYDLQIDSNPDNLIPYFDFAMKSYRRANIKSKRYGRYYISFIVNILSSLDLSETSKVPVLTYSESQGWQISSNLLRRLFDVCEKDKYFIHNAPGYEYIFLYLLNNLYSGNSCKEFTQAFLRKVLEVHVIDEYINDLSNAPEGLLSNNAITNLIDDYCDLS